MGTPSPADIERVNIQDELGRVHDAMRDSKDDPEALQKWMDYEESLQSRAYTTARLADVAPRQEAQRTAAERIPQSFGVEGGKRALEGIGQLWSVGKEMLGQEGAVADYTDKMMVRRLAASQGDPDFEQEADLGETAFSMAPLADGVRAVGWLKELPEAQTLFRSLGRTIKQAAIFGGLRTGASEEASSVSDVVGDKAEAITIAAALPIGVGLITRTPVAIGNFMTRMKQRAALNKAHMEELRNMLPTPSKLPISLQTGNVRFAAFERQVQQNTAQNYFNDLYGEFADTFRPMMSSMEKAAKDLNATRAARGGGQARPTGTDDMSSLGVATRINRAFNEASGKAQRAASHLYGQTMSDAVARAAADKAPFPIDFAETAKAAQKLGTEQHGEVWWRAIMPGAEKPVGAIAKLDEYFKAVSDVSNRASPNIDVGELILLRRNLNVMDQEYYKALRTTGGAPATELVNRHRALSGMIDAVDKDVDRFIATNPSTRPAVEGLKIMQQANSTFRDFKDIQSATRESAVAKLFGYWVPGDAEKALADIASREPAEQHKLLSILRENDPAALASLRYSLLRNAMADATSGAGRMARRGKVDPEQWAKALLDRHGKVIGSELFTPAEYARLKRGISNVRVLAGSTEGQVDPNAAVSVESGLMAAATMATAFVARTLFRLGGSGKLENLLLTDKGLRSLDVLADVHRGTWAKYKPNQITEAVSRLKAIADIPEEEDQ